MRAWLTDGNIDFAKEFQAAIGTHFDRPAQETGQIPQSIPPRQKLSAHLGAYLDLKRLGLIQDIPDRETTKDKAGNSIDESSFASPAPFSSLIAEDIVETLGRAGADAVTTVAEALLAVNALANAHGAKRVYYRDEHNYGWALKSRAQRKMELASGKALPSRNGITDIEIQELRRFQRQVRCDRELKLEISRYGRLPKRNDPEWLPVMQHYDEDFGTRMLDITSSIFSGLHFACVDWDGTIDFDTDGLLYMFFDHGRYYRYKEIGGFDDEISEFVPKKVKQTFKDWRHPEYIHHFKSARISMREVAQDGHFFVHGDLGVVPEFGGTGKFKLCIPRWAKARIIKELWFAGYTPERIVRGNKGIEAKSRAEGQVAEYLRNTPNW